MKAYSPENGREDSMKTPAAIFSQLARIFTFDYDAACTFSNCLCVNGAWFDRNINGLKESWQGRRVFCNPPFSQKADWMAKAHKEVTENGCHVCVMVLPTSSMECPCWHEFVYGKHHYEIIEGRVSFLDPVTNKPKSGNNSGTTIVYFMKKIMRPLTKTTR